MLDYQSLTHNYIKRSLNTTHHLMGIMCSDKSLIENIIKAIKEVINCFQHNRKVMFAGNGGSAADAQHMSAEFVSRFRFNRPGLSSIALTTDTSALTAIGNDYGFEYIFSRQIEAVGDPGDVLIAYSTSGTSLNILKALNTAREKKILCIGLTGTKPDSEKMTNKCNISLCIPHKETSYIQEGHLVIGNLICGAVEDYLFKQKHNQ